MNSDSALTREMQMTEAIQQALQADKRTASYPIEVEVQGATAVLRGSVESQDHKEAAEHIARGVAGVINVTNELVIEAGGGGLFGARSHGGQTAPAGPAGAVPLAAGTSGSGAGPNTAVGLGYVAPLATPDVGDMRGTSDRDTGREDSETARG